MSGNLTFQVTYKVIYAIISIDFFHVGKFFNIACELD
jgi:hypothetical protein